MRKYMYSSKLYFVVVVLSSIVLFSLGTYFFLFFNENIFFESYLALTFMSLYGVTSFIDTKIGGIFYTLNLIMVYIILFNYNFVISGLLLMFVGTPAYIYSIFQAESEKRFFFVFENMKTVSRKKFILCVVPILALVFIIAFIFIKNDLNGLLYDITIGVLIIATAVFTYINNSKKWLFRVLYSNMILLIFNIYEVDLIFIFMELLRVIFCFASFLFVMKDMETINKLSKSK